jgi:small subunit ribosomal protein S8
MADYDHALAPASRLNIEFARLLQDEGYIEGFSVERMLPPRGRRRRSGKTEFDMLHVRLKYAEDRTPVISGLKRVSKPGRRRYVKADELPRVLGGMGTAILTTSGGVMTAYEAKRKRLGGEVVAYIW